MVTRGTVSLRALVLAAAVLAGACQEDAAPTTRASDERSEQSFEEAMRIVCSAPEQAELPPESAGAANRAMMIAMWIDQRVHNQEVRQLMGGLAAQTNAGKLEALAAGARRAGIARCALAELWRAGPAAASRAATEGGKPLRSEPQTYDEAIAILCDAPRRADLPAQPADGIDEVAALSGLVRAEISNRDVSDLFTSLRSVAPSERVRLLRQAAAKSGVPACSLADRWSKREE